MIKKIPTTLLTSFEKVDDSNGSSASLLIGNLYFRAIG